MSIPIDERPSRPGNTVTVSNSTEHTVAIEMRLHDGEWSMLRVIDGSIEQAEQALEHERADWAKISPGADLRLVTVLRKIRTVVEVYDS